MLINLKTVHKPAALEDAVRLLATPGTYPLYGGVALQRRSSPEVEAAISLDRLRLNTAQDGDHGLLLGSMLTLEEARQAGLARRDQPEARALADLLAAEQPETLRNTMTLGDLLVERDPQSLVLTLLLALGATIDRAGAAPAHLSMASFLADPADVGHYLLTGLRLPVTGQGGAIAHEKVARTPADAPIVGAVAWVQVSDSGQVSTLALCGVDAVPVRQMAVARAFDETGDVEAALAHLELDPPGDHWGSREYRAEMARVMARRALLRAASEAR